MVNKLLLLTSYTYIFKFTLAVTTQKIENETCKRTG